MLSSKIQEIKRDAQEVADDISTRAQAVASDVSVETKETLSNVGDRVAREGVEIKSELDLLFGKINDLLQPEASADFRQYVRERLEGANRKAAAWAEGRENEQEGALKGSGWHMRRTAAKHPLTALLVTVGTGALVTYWLAHRHAHPVPGH